MPPSFPVGGMENPRLSFITPTVIAGDKSLVSVIAHELAHSWSGNLVTNATWRDLWLNEGFTDYLESRIMNAVYGEQRAMMEAVLGLRSLRDDLATLKPADQVLAIDLRDRDPDECSASAL
jgi:leukotriene-A4 hydrolase